MKIKYYLLPLILAFSTTIVPQADTFNEPEITAAPLEQAKVDIYKEFQFTIADLAHKTHTLINECSRAVYHPYFEVKKPVKKVIDTIENEFYTNGGYSNLVKSFKRDKKVGIDEAIGLYKKLAQKVKVKLPDSNNLVLDEQKIDWLKQASKVITQKYKSLKPTFKESFITSVKRAILLNRLTANWDLKTFNQLSSLIFPFMGLYGAAQYSKKLYNEGYLCLDTLSTLGAVIGANFATLCLDSFFGYLDTEKERLKEREAFRQSSQEEKEIKKQLNTLVSHTGNGHVGLRKIAGIQDNDIIKELIWYIDWLQQPIAFYGSRLSIVLYGEPGNGKGIITKALSDESSTPLITISAEDVRNKKMSLKLWAAEHIAEKRKEKSVIVFFDEIDLILTQKNSAELQEFLTLLDSGTKGINPHVRILYVFATNHIKNLDPRLMRPGRIKSKLYVGPPTLFEQRYNLIADSMKEVFGGAPHEIASLLAEETNGLSRVAIDEVIRNTYNHAILTEEQPSIERFLYEVKKIKDVVYHSSEQIA